MKVIAFYLPQFHAIPENDEWWGKGFTEWVNLKKAKPLFDGHNQPRVPLDNNYYNLLDPDIKHQQVALAKEYGIYGFCFYHYWFDGHMLLQKPVEQYLEDKTLDLPFCLCWANEAWTNAWVSKKNTVLIAQRYGKKSEWEEHFSYLLPFFKDTRYIKENKKPLVVIYRPELIECLNEMLDCWNYLAVENGFDGLVFAYQHSAFDDTNKRDDSRFTYNIESQPNYALRDINSNRSAPVNWLRYTKRFLCSWADKYLKTNLTQVNFMRKKLVCYNYDEVWRAVLNHEPESEKCIPGAFVDWDNTPRRGDLGSVFIGATPQKFGQYLQKQIRRAKEVYHKDMIFIFSWNEWAEGGYLEPDEKNGYAYLEAVRDALRTTDEFPVWSENK